MKHLDFTYLFYKWNTKYKIVNCWLKTQLFYLLSPNTKNYILVLNAPYVEGLIYGDDWMAYNYLCHTVPDETSQLTHALWQEGCNNWAFSCWPVKYFYYNYVIKFYSKKPLKRGLISAVMHSEQQWKKIVAGIYQKCKKSSTFFLSINIF